MRIIDTLFGKHRGGTSPRSSDAWRYDGPDDQTVLLNPTAEQLERELRDRPHAYWLQGGNGEATLTAEHGDISLWIKQPEAGWFFLTYSRPKANWLVPYDGGSCDDLVEDERGGDPFLIPRACLIATDKAVDAVTFFLNNREPTPELLMAVLARVAFDRRGNPLLGRRVTPGMVKQSGVRPNSRCTCL